MLLKKIDRGFQFIEEHIDLFRCPKCHSSFVKIIPHAIRCEKGHQFDVSKKGTLHFLAHDSQTDYNKDMLTHRKKMIQIGLYSQLLERIADFLKGEKVDALLDMGCGEGSFLQELDTYDIDGVKIGFDISKEGIALATEHSVEAFWCVADLTNLPFADHSMSHLLTIFSPSQYGEVRRVLKTGGKLIKVIPESGYLKELRELFYRDAVDKQVYSNEKVLTKFAEEMTVVKEERVTYSFPVPTENYEDLLKMSPLHWGASRESLNFAAETTIEMITIDVTILIGQQ